MTVYMADRDLPGITLEQLAAAQKAAYRDIGAVHVRGEASPVHPEHLRSR